MELKERITAYIIKNAPVTMDTIIEVATKKGFAEADILTALDKVHSDKRINNTTSASGVVLYKLAAAKKDPTDHLKWVRDNYPTMDSTNDGSGIEADYSFLFMSPDEAKEYKAAVKGIPMFMLQSKKYGNSRR